MIGRVLAIAGAVVADARRRKVVWVVALFAVVMAAAIPSLPSYGVGVVEAVYREVALAVSYVAVMVLTLALAANRIPAEVERRTLYAVLGRTVRRWEYVMGTWLGIVATLGAVTTAFTLVVVSIGWLAYGVPMWVLAQGAFAVWLESAVLAAFCVAISAVAGPVVVSTAALAFLFIAHTREALLEPGTLAYAVYPSLDAFNIIAPVAHGTGVGIGYAAAMLAAFVGWAGALLLAGNVMFLRKDL